MTDPAQVPILASGHHCCPFGPAHHSHSHLIDDETGMESQSQKGPSANRRRPQGKLLLLTVQSIRPPPQAERASPEDGARRRPQAHSQPRTAPGPRAQDE